MISIKKYLSLNNQVDRSWMDAARALITAIAGHAVTGEAEDLTQFRETIAQASDALADGIGPETVLEQTGAVVKSLAEYNRRVVWFQRFQTSELQSMVRMLTSAVGAVAATGETSSQALANIERQVAVVSDLNDVRLMKARLSGCLAEIRMQAARQRTETEKTIQELRNGLIQFQSIAHGSGDRGDRGVNGDRNDGPNPYMRAKLPTRLRPDVPLSELGRSVSIHSQPSWSPAVSRN